MSRSKWKGPFIKKSLLNIEKKLQKTKNIKIWSRNSTIPFSLIGQQIAIHNGKEFIRIKITREKVGYKLGEFSFTRKHKIKAKKTKNEKKPIKK